jgi:hypothetical protein
LYQVKSGNPGLLTGLGEGVGKLRQRFDSGACRRIRN